MATAKDRVLELCTKNGIRSIRELERKAGVSYNVISNWDKYQPSADNLYKVADFFHVSTDYILYGNDPNDILPTAEKEKPTATVIAIGENEVTLLETFRQLSKRGKFKILMLASEELEAEQAASEEKDDSSSSTSKVG